MKRKKKGIFANKDLEVEKVKKLRDRDNRWFNKEIEERDQKRQKRERWKRIEGAKIQ